ncbi:hypothetical protein KBW71_11580 [Hydrogenophaga aromaticivorans]|uniref:hypothetical protein n=1 Tax=Hydrogenophaga aromaticivorans TaxID=2610898 RepID=UPI001B361923|nr:hypothetical protein [Hydrogenophaga aromaticivorans]MBQ0919078.1 hypothetical protein [Hydrogenophaga aromaticivorans]
MSSAAFTRRPLAAWDIFSGPHSVSGTVKVLTTPAARPVVLMDEESWLVVRSTQSAADGTYAFPKVCAGSWRVFALDDQGAYNMVGKDRVVTQP